MVVVDINVTLMVPSDMYGCIQEATLFNIATFLTSSIVNF
jgi:hypothetical protein